MNKVILIGNVGTKPEYRKLDDGREMTTCSLATNEKWKPKDSTETKQKTTWHNLLFSGAIAPVIAEFVSSGHKLAVTGKIDNYEYAKEDGTKGYGSRIIVSEVEFLTPKSNETPATGPAPMPENATSQGADPNDDLPF